MKRLFYKSDITHTHAQLVSAMAFIFFSAWMISFPYEGQVLYALSADKNFDVGIWMKAAIGVLILGLLGGALISSVKAAKMALLICGAVCFVVSGVFFFPFSPFWPMSLLLLSFYEGLWIASWGWFYRLCTPSGARIKTASACLSVSAVLMIFTDLAATRISPHLGLICAMLLILASLIMTAELPPSPIKHGSSHTTKNLPATKGLLKPLCLFIIIITINSGLMFSVVIPEFSNLPKLTDWYWAVPYIVAILVVSRLPKTVDRSYVLFVAISMLGLSFLAFMTLGRSVSAYMVVDTLLLAACGINDLFWWTVLGEILDYYENPAKILGIGMAANVAGVLLGEILASITAFYGHGYLSPFLGIAVVCVSLLILPPLQKKLDRHMKDSRYILVPEPIVPNCDAMISATNEQGSLFLLPESENISADTVLAKPCDCLTDRELQIVQLLLKGYTRQLVVSELTISESTVKTHIRNIYVKLEVKNKTELIQKLKGK